MLQFIHNLIQQYPDYGTQTERLKRLDASVRELYALVLDHAHYLGTLAERCDADHDFGARAILLTHVQTYFMAEMCEPVFNKDKQYVADSMQFKFQKLSTISLCFSEQMGRNIVYLDKRVDEVDYLYVLPIHLSIVTI